MQSDRPDLLSRPVPRWVSLLCVGGLLATGLVLAVVAKASGASAPAVSHPVVSVAIPPNGLPGLTPQQTPDYTVLVLSGSALNNLNLPGVHPWGGFTDVAEGKVATIGGIVLCTAGRPGSVRILSVKALRGADTLTVLRFSTRPVGTEVLGFNRGSLDASGFPPAGAGVSACHGTYQQALIGVHGVATTELGIEFEMSSNQVEEDKGLVLTYEGADEVPRTLDIPIDVGFCEPGYCPASAAS